MLFSKSEINTIRSALATAILSERRTLSAALKRQRAGKATRVRPSELAMTIADYGQLFRKLHKED